MKKTLADRTRQLLKELEINQVELAEMAGRTKGAINQWLGKTTPESVMDPECAWKIADKTNYHPRWLMIGEGPERRTTNDGDEDHLIELFRAADPRGQATILQAAEAQANYTTNEEEPKPATKDHSAGLQEKLKNKLNVRNVTKTGTV